MINAKWHKLTSKISYEVICMKGYTFLFQSLFLASALTKFIWSSMATTARSHEFSIPKMARIISVRGGRRIVRSNDMSTSENSASLNSNSEGESSEERSDMSDGPTPRKKPKKENIFAYSDNGKSLAKKNLYFFF